MTEIKNMKFLQKETLLKIIDLIELTQRKKINQIINESLENVNFDVIEKEHIMIKLNSIKSDIIDIKYNHKLIADNVQIYYYETHTTIYTQEKDLKSYLIKNEISNKKIYDYATIINNKKKIKINIDSIEEIEKTWTDWINLKKPFDKLYIKLTKKNNLLNTE